MLTLMSASEPSKESLHDSFVCPRPRYALHSFRVCPSAASRSLALLGAGRVKLLIGNESPLRQPRQTHKRQSDEKVHGGGKEPDSQVIVVHARKLAVGLPQLHHRDHRDQGSILATGDKVIR